MAPITRREWHRLTLGGIAGAAAGIAGADALGARPQTPAASRPASLVRGVQIGVQSYSFRDRPLDATVNAIAAIGISSCELWQNHVEPRVPRDELRRWRLTVPMEHFTSVRRTFDRAGIELYAYNLSFQDDFTDEEVRRGFEMAAALGVKVMTASANQGVVTRVAPVAERFKMRVGMHNHSHIAPNEFATPDDLTRAMAVSPYIAANLDIGHFTAANFDAVAFLAAHHDRIVTLHIKDRKRNDGDNVPFGEGDTPIKPVLALLRDRKWAIPANIEYEYDGGDTVREVKRCFEYCKAALEGAQPI